MVRLSLHLTRFCRICMISVIYFLQIIQRAFYFIKSFDGYVLKLIFYLHPLCFSQVCALRIINQLASRLLRTGLRFAQHFQIS